MRNAIDFINELKQEGFQFSLDDFGSGMSSFAYLKTLPVDYLKIDGMFVKQMHRDKFDRAMVKSISEIGKVMEKKKVAEFVENEEIMQWLSVYNIDYAQGFYIMSPKPLESLA